MEMHCEFVESSTSATAAHSRYDSYGDLHHPERPPTHLATLFMNKARFASIKLSLNKSDDCEASLAFNTSIAKLDFTPRQQQSVSMLLTVVEPCGRAK